MGRVRPSETIQVRMDRQWHHSVGHSADFSNRQSMLVRAARNAEEDVGLGKKRAARRVDGPEILLQENRGGSLHRYCGALRGNTLPLAARHFYPGIGPTLVNVHRLAGCVGALTFEAAGSDGNVAEDRDFHILVLGAGVFGVFLIGQRSSFVVYFSIAAGGDKFVGQQWGDYVWIICLLRLEPFLFEAGNGLFRIGLRIEPSGAYERDHGNQEPRGNSSHGVSFRLESQARTWIGAYLSAAGIPV